MIEFVKYPSIEQYRNVVKEVKFLTPEGQLPPTLYFTGTVKLHGTNAGISMNTDTGQVYAQSRNKILTLEEDNAGFAKYVFANREYFKLVCNYYLEYGYQTEGLPTTITLFGEWCGGNIQKGVGITGLDKMFVQFGVKAGDRWLNVDEWRYNRSINFYNIYQFPTYEMSIDFKHPELATERLVVLTEQVEQMCPVAKHFNSEGIGEGIVWEASYLGNPLRFKVKGEKHSASKVKKLVQIDPEKLSSIVEFVEYAVTENRLNQGIEQVFTTHSKEPDIKELGSFIKWVMQDVAKEESDTLKESDLTMKDVTKQAVDKVRYWFIAHLDSNL